MIQVARISNIILSQCAQECTFSNINLLDVYAVDAVVSFIRGIRDVSLSDFSFTISDVSNPGMLSNIINIYFADDIAIVSRDSGNHA